MNKPGFVFVSVLIFVYFLCISDLSGQNAYTKLCLKAVSCEEAGKFDEAIASYGEAINLRPEEWTGYSYRAKVFIHLLKYNDAIADLSKAISLSPQTLSLYAARAGCFEARGDYDRAIDDYGMALSKDSNSGRDAYMTYFERGRTYFYANKFQESLNDLNTATQLAKKAQKSLPEISLFRAKSNIELKRYQEAITDLESFLAINPENIEALWLKGFSLYKNGETEKARAIANQIIKMEPAKEVYFSGNRNFDIFNFEILREKSERLVTEAKELISEHYTTPSRTLAGMKLTDAFQALDSAWLLSPGLTKEDLSLKDTILKNIFVVYPLMKTKPEISEQVRRYAVQASNATQEKRYDDAIVLWTTTLKIAPYYPLAYYNRALLYEMKGNLKYSIADMENYLKLTPDAADARSARDRIYTWEGKIKETGAAPTLFQAGKINQIESKSYSPGNFKFAMALGGTFGLQVSKNPDLEELWVQSTLGATPDHAYSDKMPFLFSGDLELTVRPIKRLGIGAFGKYAGGIGTRTSVSEVKYIMDMGTLMYGGFIRGYLLVNNGAAKPDLYVQYGFGKSQLTGYYGIATMDGIIFDYSFLKRFTGSDILHSAGVGMGGKIGKHGYLTISADYLLSEIKKINYEVTIDKNNSGNVGSEGVVINTLSDSNTSAKYNGVVLKMLFGICF